MKKKRTKATDFKTIDRLTITSRDGGCIFCKMSYHNEDLTEFEKAGFQIMHYIPRSQGGLGIPQNGAVGCIGHHMMLDNGNQGRADEMKELFRNYLKSRYPNWNEKNLVYKKYNF